MTFKELAIIVYNNYPDLYDSPDEIYTELRVFIRQIQFDISKLKEVDISYLGSLVVTEKGKPHQRAAMTAHVKMKDVWYARWVAKHKKDEWKKRLIDIYFNLC